jgi:hypothetical protein
MTEVTKEMMDKVAEDNGNIRQKILDLLLQQDVRHIDEKNKRFWMIFLSDSNYQTVTHNNQMMVALNTNLESLILSENELELSNKLRPLIDSSIVNTVLSMYDLMSQDVKKKFIQLALERL